MPSLRGLVFLAVAAAALVGDAAGANSSSTSSSSCPLNLTYVSTFPWDTSPCSSSAASANVTNCCQSLLSLFGIALAERLRSTGLFRLPDAATSAACLTSFSAALSSPPLSLSAELVPSCWDPGHFAISESFCAGVLTAAQFASVVGNATLETLDNACAVPRCLDCYSAGAEAQAALLNVDGNSSHNADCFYLTVLYAAGISSAAGPYNSAVASCTLGLGLAAPAPSNLSRSSATSSVVAYAVAIPVAFLLLAAAGVALFFRFRRRKQMAQLGGAFECESSTRRLHPRPNTGSILFDITEIAKATDSFATRNYIGRGGFGVVYKGVLADNTVVAVKKMLDPDMDAGDDEFRNEVEIISQLRHRNLVPLRGCCIADDGREKQRFLVYDFMPNGSLERHIFTSVAGGDQPRRPALTWTQRRRIILDIAKGIEYLHYGVKPAIFHRDIKASNILLDDDMCAHLADFGLARQSREGHSHLTTRVAGTRGYLAPEYALYGQLTERSDVYSFGVLLLEVMSGRHALDMSATSEVVLITDWAWMLHKAGRTREVVDPAVTAGTAGDLSPRRQMERFVQVGILCAHVVVAFRPTIREALRMLEGDVDVPEIVDRPLPLEYGSILGNGDGGSNSSVSPSASGTWLRTGDMLR